MAKRRQPRGVGQGLLRPTLRPNGILVLDDTIAALVELDANGLCLQWRNHLGGTPPAHFPRLAAHEGPSPTSGFGETKLFCIRRIGVLVVTMAVASTSARA